MAGGGIPCIEYLIQDWNFYLVFYWKPVKQLETAACKILCTSTAQTCFPQKRKYFNGNEGNHCASQGTS